MSLGQVPAWLDTRPADFTAAAEGGARLGLEAKSQADQQTQDQARLGLQAQAQRQQVAQTQQAQQLEQERLAAQQSEAQQRLQLETQTAARKFQAQQGYQQAVQGGMDPIHAMMLFGPSMGESMAGLGPLAMSQTRMQQAAVPPQPVEGGQTYNGRFYPTPQSREKAQLPEKLSDANKMMAQYLISELKDVDKEETANATMPDAATARSLRNRRDQAEQKLKKLGVDVGDGESPDAAADNAPKDQPKEAQGGYKIGATYKGGLKYLGGDPNDEASWQQAGSAAQ